MQYHEKYGTSRIGSKPVHDGITVFQDLVPALQGCRLGKPAGAISKKGERRHHVAEKVPEKKAAVKMTSQRRCFSQNERTAVYNKSEGRCAICGKFVPFESFTVDHIIPLAKGGSNDMSNLQCACKTCNRIKQDILPEELMDKLTEIMLYQVTMKKNKKYKKTLRKACKKNK